MKGVAILWFRWTSAALLAAALVLPQRLGAQVPGQGIKVHGHWVVEVRNADGSLELRREFENALQPQGKQVLLQLLAAQKAMGLWQVIVYGSSSGVCNAGFGTICRVVEPSSVFPPGIDVFKNLTKTATGALELVLQGSFVVAITGEVREVATFIEGANAATDVAGTFTSTVLQSPIPVQATQTVSVTVTLSFS